MLLTIDEFQKKYNISDPDISSYDDETKRIITEVLNGNVGEHADSQNNIILFYIGKYCYYVKKDASLTQKYYLMAIEHGNISAMNNLGLLYDERYISNLAEKYYLMAAEHGDPKGMNNLGVLCKQQNKFDLAEKYYLMAIDQNNSSAMNNLGLLYEAQRKFNLAAKYYIKALSFDANVISKIIAIIPKLSSEQQLQVLELVPQIRNMNEIINIPPTVYFQFMKKNMKISRYLSRYLIDDIVDICLAYY